MTFLPKTTGARVNHHIGCGGSRWLSRTVVLQIANSKMEDAFLKEFLREIPTLDTSDEVSDGSPDPGRHGVEMRVYRKGMISGLCSAYDKAVAAHASNKLDLMKSVKYTFMKQLLGSVRADLSDVENLKIAEQILRSKSTTNLAKFFKTVSPGPFNGAEARDVLKDLADAFFKDFITDGVEKLVKRIADTCLRKENVAEFPSLIEGELETEYTDRREFSEARLNNWWRKDAVVFADQIDGVEENLIAFAKQSLVMKRASDDNRPETETLDSLFEAFAEALTCGDLESEGDDDDDEDDEETDHVCKKQKCC